MVSPRGRRYVAIAAVFALVLIMFLLADGPKNSARGYLDQYLDHTPGAGVTSAGSRGKGKPRYLPDPTWVPPPVKDPFHSLATSKEAPPIPEWNQPKHELHVKYDLEYAPPLFIGFTRSWPMLLQTVVSYITAGWPANQIYVIENTGVQRANAKGQLTLQNPFYMNHESLNKLGVNIVQAPVLMSFAQLQNYYMYLSHQYQWPYYYWSHQDVIALSYEDGQVGLTAKAHEEGYKTIYELALEELNRTLGTGERWGQRLFSFDNFALVNREAFEDVGGWDNFIPYYMTECDMHSRLLMGNWTIKDAHAGIINDVGSILDDLRVLYRDESIEPSYSDLNPSKPTLNKRDAAPVDMKSAETSSLQKRAVAPDTPGEPSSITYFRKLQRMTAHMQKFKRESKNRQNWLGGQRGGKDEPFYYHSRGIQQGIDVLTAAGKEVFAEKWGHRGCDLVSGAGLKLEDQWRVARDWE
ncbi:hypothetical protein NLU13_8861 [Sarocladium strictum]|uniref:Uncharacterized protein n=1 Tax=Sarocladium strictum TaxID=5046 RepID=A0AA39G938_SARSR|nr:hypothetical protein NLU13_8861 [Sarocladium strictum]